MFLEVLGPIYHSSITIQSITYGVLLRVRLRTSRDSYPLR